MLSWCMTHAQLAANRLGEPIGRYATAYLDAARVLFTHANEGRGLVDLYFYPAALNLRHGLELLAKQCSDYAAYEMRDPELLYVPGHSLQDAWERGSKIPREVVSEDYGYGERSRLLSDLAFIDALVKKLHDLDPTGALFRYPEYVQRRKQKDVVVRGARREDTHVPFDRVDLAAWADDAAHAVNASQSLLAYLEERSSWLRMHRNDPPVRLADLVTGNVSQRARDMWDRTSPDPDSSPAPGRSE